MLDMVYEIHFIVGTRYGIRYRYWCAWLMYMVDLHGWHMVRYTIHVHGWWYKLMYGTCLVHDWCTCYYIWLMHLLLYMIDALVLVHSWCTCYGTWLMHLMVQIVVQVDAWYRLVHGWDTYLVMVCGDVGSCLVEACVFWTSSWEVSLVYDPCERIWLRIGDNDRLDRLITDKLQVDVTMTVTGIVTVTVIEFLVVIVEESMTVGLHLYFRVVGRGKERGLYPPSSWS